MRIALNEENLGNLMKGKVIKVDGIQIILKDIGFPAMEILLREAVLQAHYEKQY